MLIVRVAINFGFDCFPLGKKVRKKASGPKKESTAMGNQVGKGANRMAIAAMSNVTHIEKREMTSLLQKFREIAAREGSPLVINRACFTEAMNIVGVNQNDAETIPTIQVDVPSVIHQNDQIQGGENLASTIENNEARQNQRFDATLNCDLDIFPISE